MNAMEDTFIKRAIRLFFRIILWFGKIVVSPVAFFFGLAFVMITLLMIFVAWVMNDAKAYTAQVNEWNGFWQGVIKWYSI